MPNGAIMRRLPMSAASRRRADAVGHPRTPRLRIVRPPADPGIFQRPRRARPAIHPLDILPRPARRQEDAGAVSARRRPNSRNVGSPDRSSLRDRPGFAPGTAAHRRFLPDRRSRVRPPRGAASPALPAAARISGEPVQHAARDSESLRDFPSARRDAPEPLPRAPSPLSGGTVIPFVPVSVRGRKFPRISAMPPRADDPPRSGTLPISRLRPVHRAIRSILRPPRTAPRATGAGYPRSPDPCRESEAT